MRPPLTALRARVRSITYFSPGLLACGLAFALCAELVAFVILQAIPWEFGTSSPVTVAYDVPVVELGRPALGVLVLLLGLGLVPLVERGIRDRFEPWALAGLGLCFLGFAGCMRGALTVSGNGGLAGDLTVFKAAFASLVAGMVCAAIAGWRLRGSPRRGRVFVLCALALPPWWILVVRTALVDPTPLLRSWETEIDMPRIAHANVVSQMDARFPVVELWLDEGELAIRYEGQRSTRAGLGAHLVECARSARTATFRCKPCSR